MGDMMTGHAVLLMFYAILGSGIAAYKSYNEDLDELISKREVVHVLNLMDLTWGSSLIVIYDCQIGLNLSNSIVTWTEKRGVVTISFYSSNFYDVMSQIVVAVMAERNIKTFRSVLNVLVFFDDRNSIHQITKQIHTVDQDFGRRALLRHFSKWLFVCTRKISKVFPNLNTYVDNIAVVFSYISTENNSAEDNGDHGIIPCQQVKLDNEERKERACFSIKTLLWKPRRRQWSSIGFIDTKHNTTNMSGPLFPNTEYGLNGRELRVGVMEVCKDLCDILGESLNFSYIFVEPSDKIWGEMLPNKSWNGLLGMVVKDEIDLAGVPYGTTLERMSFMSFSHTIMYSTYQVAYRREESNRNHWWQLVSCFKWEVYACGFVALLWCVCLVALMEGLTPTYTNDRHSCCREHILLVVMTTLSTPLNQAGGYLPRKSPIRILFASWCIFCIMVTAVYTGNLVAFMTADKENTPFSNLEELVSNDGYKVTIPRGSYMESYLKHSTVDIMKSLWKKIIASKNIKINNSVEEKTYQTSLLQSGHVALIDVADTLDLIDDPDSNIRRMSQDLASVPLSLPFPTNSPLEPMFSEKIMNMDEYGVLNALRRKWARKKPVIDKSRRAALTLEITDLQSGLTACAIGVFVSVLCLITENIWKNFKAED